MPRDNKYLQLPRRSLVRELAAAICFCLVATSPLWAFDWIAENRAAVEKMSPAEKQDLDDKYQRFLALPPATQDELRLLNQQLSSDANGGWLRHVMLQYYDWLITLNAAQRAGLAAQPNDKARLAMIEKLRQEQQAQAAGSHMTPDDMHAITDFVKKYAVDHESELRRADSHHDFPHRHPPANDTSAANPNRSNPIRGWSIWARERQPLPHISPEEIDALAQKLSKKPRDAIKSQATYANKEKLVQGWLQAIARTRSGRQGAAFNAAAVTKFFQSLPKDEQQRLLDISDSEQRRHELWRDYLQAHPRAGRMRPGPDGDNAAHSDGPVHSGPPPGKHFGPDDPDAPGPKPATK